MQSPYDHIPGVVNTTVGYMGGSVIRPTYDQVSTGRTGHYEVIQVEYDPSRVSYNALLDVYWKNVDPTDQYGQFADLGPQYRPVIFYHSPEQRLAAAASKEALAASRKFEKPIVVTIKPAATFYPAEDYHQQYYRKQPIHYERYKVGSGRAGFIQKKWGPK
ncbi:peptide-methionine (S)-S-oxide reductase [bacterium]|nr:peptide-methionine (S)-S-oxide reductase [bacterium]